jgi:hypothetical protein
MATLIPVTGETVDLAPPDSRDAIRKILGIPHNSSPQWIEDLKGNVWWYWKRGHDRTKLNKRAMSWFKGVGVIHFQGPVLYTSKEENSID